MRNSKNRLIDTSGNWKVFTFNNMQQKYEPHYKASWGGLNNEALILNISRDRYGIIRLYTNYL